MKTRKMRSSHPRNNWVTRVLLGCPSNAASSRTMTGDSMMIRTTMPKDIPFCPWVEEDMLR